MSVLLRQRGLTLIEIVIVLAIVGVLITLALPGYRQQVLTTNRVIATAELRKLVARQEQFRQSYRRYATDLAELGLQAARYGLDRQGNSITASDRSSVYVVDLNVDGGQTTVLATPQRSQAADRECGMLGLTMQGRRTISGTGTLSDCW